MSKTDNLTDFLTDVADAIREKKGTTDKINPQNFSEEIRGIESGGGGIPTAEWNDVNFYDYEGTILYSYTWDEFVAKNEMPPLPTHHERLICQEWNYTLEEVLEQGGRCDVGALYATKSGITEVIVNIVNETIRDAIWFSTSSERVVNWGDGTEEVVIGNAYHEYANIGRYLISIGGVGGISFKYPSPIDEVNAMCDVGFRVSTVNRISLSNSSKFSADILIGAKHLSFSRKNINVASIVNIQTLLSLSATNNTTFINPFNFNLNNIHIPSNVANIGTGGSYRIQNMSCSLANHKYRVDGNCLIDLESKSVIAAVSRFSLPADGVTSIGRLASFLTANSLVIPDSVVSIATNCFFDVKYSTCVVSPNITTIPSGSFAYPEICNRYDFSRNSNIPTLENTNAFTSIPSACKIVVPDNLYDEWIAATNWSSFASRIVKASEFVEPTTE